MTRLRRRLFVSGAVVLGVQAFGLAPLFAESTVSSGTFVLRDVLDIARRENPEIVAARRRWDAAQARISQAATPEKPRVDIERMYAPRGENPWSGAEEKNIAVSQEIPFPTTLYFASRRARQEADQAKAAYRAKELDVMVRVKTAYAMLFLSRHAIHIFEENARLMSQFAKVAESKYAAGRSPQADALKAQVELSKMLNELVTLEQEKETNKAMLNTLLNRPPDALLGEPADPEPQKLALSLNELEALALQAKPEMKEAALGVEKAGTVVTLSRSDYLPDLMMQYRRREMSMGTESHDAMLGLTLPLWFWRQGAMVREAKAEREMAQAEFQAMKNMSLFDVKNLLVKAQAALRLVELYQTSVLPQAEQVLKVTEAAYRSDAMNFLDLLDAVRTLLNFRLEHYEHLALYEQFTAELERAVGGVFQSSNQKERQ